MNNKNTAMRMDTGFPLDKWSLEGLLIWTALQLRF